MSPPASAAAPRRHPQLSRDLAVTAMGLLCLIAWDWSGLDLAVARHYGNAAGFAWREHWWTRDVLHNGGRWLAFGAMGLIVWNLWRPVFRGQTRRDRWWWLGLTLVCLLAVPALKQLSLTSCPWSLAEFGGTATHVSHWRLGVGDGGSGRCFPSGHATAAFAYLSGWFMLRDTHPRAARRWQAAVLAFGLLFAWAQTARGAHYPSHSMWTAWLCWTICTTAVAARALYRRPAADAD